MAPRTAPARGFPVSEYRTRLSRAQMMMAKAGLSALLLKTEAKVRFFYRISNPIQAKPDAGLVFDRTCIRRPGCGDPIDWRGLDGQVLDQGYSHIVRTRFG